MDNQARPISRPNTVHFVTINFHFLNLQANEVQTENSSKGTSGKRKTQMKRSIHVFTLKMSDNLKMCSQSLMAMGNTSFIV